METLKEDVEFLLLDSRTTFQKNGKTYYNERKHITIDRNKGKIYIESLNDMLCSISEKKEIGKFDVYPENTSNWLGCFSGNPTYNHKWNVIIY